MKKNVKGTTKAVAKKTTKLVGAKSTTTSTKPTTTSTKPTTKTGTTTNISKSSGTFESYCDKATKLIQEGKILNII